MSSEIKWQKSSFSGGGGEQCLHVAKRNGEILLCESDDPDNTITTSPEKLAAFIQGVKAGEFDHFVN
ncbi:DUF397 domain-containing protein [Streptomyces sp. A3M-1-3]|uniref:DUF397 domain-containing protein n=1 Tax=Streptomyces sp. A3M-1-3 TaxID=2962044 RepID=UPI0020B7B695|nr:DUF397 domain-containing protein [Streptomyces sp. A3M-1-3]MCP3822389.1 DUF397 domain-containing protein [Streptomyces sp. A3M-1-3]